MDESRDVAVIEQMAVVFGYLDKTGCIIESFIRIVYVKNTYAKSLKSIINVFFCKIWIKFDKFMGQGYNEARI